MAAEVHQFTVTIPAGTPQSAPFTQAIGLANYEVESIDLEVPPGPAGLMGFRIALNGQQWIPWEQGQWIVWNNREKSWPLIDQPNIGAWSIVGYNTGVYPHSVTVRLHVNPLSPVAAASAPSVTVIQSGVVNPVPVAL